MFPSRYFTRTSPCYKSLLGARSNTLVRGVRCFSAITPRQKNGIDVRFSSQLKYTSTRSVFSLFDKILKDYNKYSDAAEEKKRLLWKNKDPDFVRNHGFAGYHAADKIGLENNCVYFDRAAHSTQLMLMCAVVFLSIHTLYIIKKKSWLEKGLIPDSTKSKEAEEYRQSKQAMVDAQLMTAEQLEKEIKEKFTKKVIYLPIVFYDLFMASGCLYVLLKKRPFTRIYYNRNTKIYTGFLPAKIPVFKEKIEFQVLENFKGTIFQGNAKLGKELIHIRPHLFSNPQIMNHILGFWR